MIHNLFPTPIYIHEPDNRKDAVQQEIQSCLDKALKEKDLEAFSSFSIDIQREESNRSLFFNKRNLLERYDLEKFKNLIVEQVKNYVHATRWNYAFDPKTPWNGDINIYDCIFYRTKTNDFRDEHTHPFHHISGVYYHKIDKDHGSIYFKNPVHTLADCQFPEGPKSPNKIEVHPAEGTLLLFPSWLSHGTNPSVSNNERITVVFNIDLIT